MCRNRTVGGSGTRLYSSLPLSSVVHNVVMMCMQTCYCAYKPIGYPFSGCRTCTQVVSAFPVSVVVFFCALKANNACSAG